MLWKNCDIPENLISVSFSSITATEFRVMISVIQCRFAIQGERRAWNTHCVTLLWVLHVGITINNASPVSLSSMYIHNWNCTLTWGTIFFIVVQNQAVDAIGLSSVCRLAHDSPEPGWGSLTSVPLCALEPKARCRMHSRESFTDLFYTPEVRCWNLEKKWEGMARARKPPTRNTATWVSRPSL